MTNRAILSLMIAVATGIAGCGQRKEVAVTESNNDKAVEQEAKNEERPKQQEPKHGDHKHAFTNPVEQAKKWNDPERDKWQHPEEIVAALDLKPGAIVADIGAGTGYMVAPISKVVGKDGTVIAIDASAEMVEYLGKRKDELGLAKVMPRKVGPDDPELPSASVDRVLMLDTWHHVKGREAYAKKVYEGLKRGGRFVVVDYEPGAEVGPPKAMRLEPGQVKKQLEAAGFRVEVVRESMPRHYMASGTRISCRSSGDRPVDRVCSRTPAGCGWSSGSDWRTRPWLRLPRWSRPPAEVPSPARPGGGRRTGAASPRWTP